MTVLNPANAVLLGDQPVDAVYAGAVKVWPLIIDRFEDVTNTPLPSHVADDGGTWVNAVAGTSLWISDEGRVHKIGTTATNIDYYSVSHPTNVIVEFDIVIKSIITTPSNAIGIYLRHPGTAADTGYLVDFVSQQTGPRQFRLMRVLNGAVQGAQSLYTPSPVTVAGATYHCRFEVRNSFQQLSVDGVPRLNTADAAITGPGKIAVRGAGPIATGDQTGIHLDNLAYAA